MSKTANLGIAGLLLALGTAGAFTAWRVTRSAQSETQPTLPRPAQTDQAARSTDGTSLKGSVGGTSSASSSDGPRSAAPKAIGERGGAQISADVVPNHGQDKIVNTPSARMAKDAVTLANMVQAAEEKYGEFLAAHGVPEGKRKEVAAILANQTMDTVELSNLVNGQNLSRQGRIKLMSDLQERGLTELSSLVGADLAKEIYAFGAAGRGYKPLADSFAARCSALGMQVSETLAAEVGRTLKTTEATRVAAQTSREDRQRALNQVALRQASGKLTAEQLKVFQQMLNERQAEAQRQRPPGT